MLRNLGLNTQSSGTWGRNLLVERHGSKRRVFGPKIFQTESKTADLMATQKQPEVPSNVFFLDFRYCLYIKHFETKEQTAFFLGSPGTNQKSFSDSKLQAGIKTGEVGKPTAVGQTGSPKKTPVWSKENTPKEPIGKRKNLRFGIGKNEKVNKNLWFFRGWHFFEP